MTSANDWNISYRESAWESLAEQKWDIVVVGGGITGAGILREATRLGFRTLLVEQRDFAWGTSSRSSKLVHGGLRYLKTGQVGLTRASVQGREQLLAEGAGLIDPLGFLLAQYEDDGAMGGRLVYGAGLTVYDLMAQQWSHRYYNPQDFQMLAPYISPAGLRGGYRYQDAQTDDARLVLRIIRESIADPSVALNYVRAEQLIHGHDGELSGLRLRDVAPPGSRGPQDDGKRTVDVRARIIINATGAWADNLRTQVGAEQRIRPLRGSHFVFPAWRFPLAQAVSFMHPIDGRPVFAFPWEGVTLVGTTDVDCSPPQEADPCISADEVAYLMAALTANFPSLELTLDDIIATFAGIRPVIGSGKVDPSDESRDHAIWWENGLLSVTGGKLTTFHQVARQVMEQVCERLDDPDSPEGKSRLARLREDVPVLKSFDDDLLAAESLPEETRRRLLGHYGSDTPELIAASRPGELEPIPGTTAVWAELRWSARAEAVVQLDDLLLRRVRLGLLLPRGGADLLPRIREIVQSELGWDDARWEAEEATYRGLISTAYGLPDRATIPDWKAMLAKKQEEQATEVLIRHHQRQSALQGAGLTLLLMAAFVFVFWLIDRNRRMDDRLD